MRHRPERAQRGKPELHLETEKLVRHTTTLPCQHANIQQPSMMTLLPGF